MTKTRIPKDQGNSSIQKCVEILVFGKEKAPRLIKNDPIL